MLSINLQIRGLYKFTVRTQKALVFLHVLFVFWNYLWNRWYIHKLELLIDKFETDNVMLIFRITMKNKSLTFVSIRYFRGFVTLENFR